MKLRLGIAVATVKQLAELPEIKKFDFLEMPFNFAGHSDVVIPANWKKRLFRASGRSTARILNSLVDAGSAMNREFFRMFSANCTALAELNCREISIAIDWENALSDELYAAKLRSVLRCCYGIAVKHSLDLDVELRIPGNAVNDAMAFLRYRDSWLIPMRTLIDLHPHEPGSLECLEEFSGKLRFECSKIRLCFDAAGGNYLTSKLLDRIKNCIHPVGVEVPELCFYPGRNADREAYAALQSVIS